MEDADICPNKFISYKVFMKQNNFVNRAFVIYLDTSINNIARTAMITTIRQLTARVSRHPDGRCTRMHQSFLGPCRTNWKNFEACGTIENFLEH